jgi:hypothetical protein
MQHLLQFLYEHSFDKQLYCVVQSGRGELHLTWRVAEPSCWQIRQAGSQEAEHVSRASLVAYLAEQGADLSVFEQELQGLVAAHIVVADQLLAAARSVRGAGAVDAALQGQQRFVRELRQALTSALPPVLRLVR